MTQNPILRVGLGVFTGSFVGGAVAGVCVAVFLLPDIILVDNWNMEEASTGARAGLLGVIRNAAAVAIMCGVMGLMYGAPFFLLFGVPTHALLVSRRITSVIVYVLCGALISAICMSILTLLLGGARLDSIRLHDILLFAPWYAFAGAIAMATFWLIRRPDRIAPKAEAAA